MRTLVNCCLARICVNGSGSVWRYDRARKMEAVRKRAAEALRAKQQATLERLAREKEGQEKRTGGGFIVKFEPRK